MRIITREKYAGSFINEWKRWENVEGMNFIGVNCYDYAEDGVTWRRVAKWCLVWVGLMRMNGKVTVRSINWTIMSPKCSNATRYFLS